MFERIIRFSIEQRWLILLAVFDSDTGVKGTLNAIFKHVKDVATGVTTP